MENDEKITTEAETGAEDKTAGNDIPIKQLDTGIQTDISGILKSVPLPVQNTDRLSLDIQVPKSISETQTETIPAAPAEPVPQEEPSSVTALHTLKDDMQNVVRRQKISLVRAVAIEQDKRRVAPEVLTPVESTRNRHRFTIIFISLLLIILSMGALFGVAYVVQNRALPPQVSEGNIVFSERSIVVQITSSQQSGALKYALAQARTDSSDAQGSITRIIPLSASTTAGQSNATPATLSEFFTALGVQPPDGLLRSLDSSFFFGYHMTDHRAPVIVIPVVSYDNAVAGMLAWESHIDQDFSPIFMGVSATKLSADGIPVDRTFQDVVMHNYDVRVIEDDTGNPVLYYSFPSPTMLVIAENPYTFPEIINRLQAQREL
ncbi:MAG: protein of unknown function with transrane region [Candidatus Kaiserbacteria bacterium]|nr:protein of unknown function with transrane region [Candidatus Kaiserbacteria bacterium]